MVVFEWQRILWLLAIFAGMVVAFFGLVRFMLYLNQRERSAEEVWRQIKSPALPGTGQKPKKLSQSDKEPKLPKASSTGSLPSSGLPFPERPVVKPRVSELQWSMISFLAILLLVKDYYLAAFFACLVFMFLNYLKKNLLDANEKSAVGTVIDLEFFDSEPKFLGLTGGGKDARLTYRFRVPERPEEEYEGVYRTFRTSRLAMVVGRKVKVRYYAKDPRISTLDFQD